MEFSSADHSWSWHLPGLQHFKSDLKNLNPADQSSVYQTYLRSSERILTFLEPPHPPLPKAIDHSQTDTHLHLKRFKFISVRSLPVFHCTSLKLNYKTVFLMPRISLASWSELADRFLAATRALRDQYGGESVLSQNLCGQISVLIWKNNRNLCFLHQ